MAMPNHPASINLAVNKKIPFIDRFINWALNIGRLIVILTEVVAVFAFLYRFSLDQQLVDLHDSIEQKQTIISNLKNDEAKYRNLQERIELASTFSKESSKRSKIIDDIVSIIPPDGRVNELALNKDKISIILGLTSPSSLNGFVTSLKNYPEIKTVSIDTIENKPLIGLLISITSSLK